MRPNLRCLAVALALAVVAGCSRRPAASEDAASAASTTPELRGTYWKLVALGAMPITAADTAREPHIILQADTSRVNGSGGCNRMFGGYQLNGNSLTFSAIASTKMACPSGMETETAFLPALQRVARWRITGQQLELSDSAGALVARFDAKPAR